MQPSLVSTITNSVEAITSDPDDPSSHISGPNQPFPIVTQEVDGFKKAPRFRNLGVQLPRQGHPGRKLLLRPITVTSPKHTSCACNSTTANLAGAPVKGELEDGIFPSSGQDVTVLLHGDFATNINVLLRLEVHPYASALPTLVMDPSGVRRLLHPRAGPPPVGAMHPYPIRGVTGDEGNALPGGRSSGGDQEASGALVGHAFIAQGSSNCRPCHHGRRGCLATERAVAVSGILPHPDG